MTATRAYIPRLALVFDFDRTLASDSIDAILSVVGMTRDEWEERHKKPLGEDGWDDILKRSFALIRACREAGRPLSERVMREAAARIELYPDVLNMPGRLRAVAREVHGPLECEFVVLSSGFAEIISATAIGNAFDRIWAGTFHFEPNAEGEAEALAVKRVVTHPDKARYLQALAKGLDIDAANSPRAFVDGLDERDMHVPFDQTIYVGDGDSDLQAFGFLESAGGLTVAIEKGRRFDAEDVQRQGQRVENLAYPDYREASELMESLTLAVRSAASRAALRARGTGE